jgi:isopentenyl-diphosphate delta-isomerase
MEEVDIIDENNNVIGKTTKQEAHQKGLLHRCVACLVKDEKGNWLFVKQASDRQDAGQYVLPVGGHVSAGESVEHAVKRETFEETGLNDFEYKKLHQIIFNRFVIGRQENHYIILFEIHTSQKLILNHEAVSYTSFSEEQLKTELKLHPEKFGNSFHFFVKNLFPYLLYQ